MGLMTFNELATDRKHDDTGHPNVNNRSTLADLVLLLIILEYVKYGTVQGKYSICIGYHCVLIKYLCNELGQFCLWYCCVDDLI
jgi:hypothetical protein